MSDTPRINSASKKAFEVDESLPMDEKPAESAKKTEAKPDEKPVPKGPGFDLLRPFRYAKGFVVGTVKHTLDGCATAGRKGSTLGMILGLGVMFLVPGAMAAFAVEGLMAVLVFAGGGALAGLVAGAIIGAAMGLLTGGIRGAHAEINRDLQAEEAAKGVRRARGQTGLSRASFDAYEDQIDKNSDINFDRQQQQQRENQQDAGTYWQDRVSADHSVMRGL